MTDVELTRALERGQAPAGGFHHADHLRVACVYLDESPTLDEAGARMAATLRGFAASVGQSGKYNHTMTMFWVRLLAAARAAAPERRIDAVLRAYPRLLDKDLPLAYYSRQRLLGGDARSGWVDPDLQPLTLDALASDPADSPGHAPDRSLSRRPA